MTSDTGEGVEPMQGGGEQNGEHTRLEKEQDWQRRPPLYPILPPEPEYPPWGCFSLCHYFNL